MKPFLPCAIYTRKSSEEGLEQEFNSLDAQREACEAYVASQKHEGWKTLSNRYDDGGYSGGNMERPGLKRLLADIDAGKVKIVVVYKVDRLTRALSDFAKIVEQFDKKGVSFVSVTQQFNTTSSMGRLTLNVLLSFAQFEREVTSERIRDKIAASKKKGMWMGGVPPLGYEVVDKKLVIKSDEIETVQLIFETYLRLGNVRLLKDELDRLNIRTKTRANQKGKYAGGAKFSRGALYKMLINPVFAGQIRHKGKIYPGEHKAVIDMQLWQQVQAKLQTNLNAPKVQRSDKTPSLLTGIVYDDKGNRLSPTHANKNGRHYRYYVSQAILQYRNGQKPRLSRIPADEIETTVRDQIVRFINAPNELLPVLGIEKDDLRTRQFVDTEVADIVGQMAATAASSTELILSLLNKVVVGINYVEIKLNISSLTEKIFSQAYSVATAEHCHAHKSEHTIVLPIKVMRCGSEKRIVAPDSATPSIQADAARMSLAKGFLWRERFFSGTYPTLDAIAKASGVTTSHVTKLIEMSLMSPERIERIMAGQITCNTESSLSVRPETC